MRKITLSFFLVILLTISGYGQYKEPKLWNNLNIYKKDLKNKKIDNPTKEECKYLKQKAITLIKEAYLINIGNENEASNKEMKLIKEAHYFSVNWSAICK
tara:strand:- start:1138 stop:1437 length:300 start_codon:yes stop_codon:yes gene_type:complete